MGSAVFLAACAASSSGPGGGGGPGSRGGGQRGGGGPSAAMLEACSAKSSGDLCEAQGTEGTCFAPRDNLPLACVPRGAQRGSAGPGEGGGGRGGRGPGGGGARAQSNTGTPVPNTQNYTLGVLCNYTVDATNPQLQLPSQATWACERGQRVLRSNSIPMHSVGSFPNPGNPSRISEQTYSFTATTRPVALSGPGGRVKEPAVALNGVKFDPGTAGRCPSSVSDPSQCDLGRGSGPWSIEALGQDIFDFGEDANNAHVQPTGHYHYHGVPEGMLLKETRQGKAMQLIGWAADGFPIYARFGYVSAFSPLAGVRPMKSGYRLKSDPDSGRPAAELIPMGAFTNDWEYVEGSGDLDECNGRFAATPEFPEGIYHYYATDTFPYVQRCVKGRVESAPDAERRGTGGRQQRGGGRGRGRGNRPPQGGGGLQ
ncbi:MAG: YHYH protein [Pseudomonadota bacterium]